MNGLDLFSGYGGISRALRPWVRTIAYCEIERYCQGILLSEMQRGRLDRGPIWDDVRTLHVGVFNFRVDIISGGFPCQDISIAGNGKGLEGERSGLVFEYLRLIRELRPSYVFMENVPAITIRGLDRILLGLDALGYDARWTIVSAAEMGAPHLRERWWLLAHANGERGRIQPDRQSRSKSKTEFGNDGKKESMAHTRSQRLEGWVDTTKTWSEFPLGGGGGGGEGTSRLPEPAICRSADGFAHRNHRIKSLGNGVVPQCAREAFIRLSGIKGLPR